MPKAHYARSIGIHTIPILLMNVLTAPESATHEQVRDYYGRKLTSSADLKTSACCTEEAIPQHHKPILALIADEVLARFYGCGSPIPPALEGCTVLDLGCGTGRDVYVAAALVGERGRVIGVDMTEEQLAVAVHYEAEHAEKFGYAEPNTSFRLGAIEDLGAVDIEDESVDVVISNCVINLSPDKEAVFREIFRVLKPGGELYFSDVFCDRRLSEEVKSDSVLRGECLGGAMYDEDFRRLLLNLGCPDYRVVMQHEIVAEDPSLKAKLGNARFTSKTIRAFKLDSLEDRCEDFGQVAYYLGGLEGAEDAFALDDHHLFEKDRPLLVCGNSAAMIEETRYGAYFNVIGGRSTHYGLFDGCVEDSASETAGTGSCC